MKPLFAEATGDCIVCFTQVGITFCLAYLSQKRLDNDDFVSGPRLIGVYNFTSDAFARSEDHEIKVRLRSFMTPM